MENTNISPTGQFRKVWDKIGQPRRTAFLSAFLIGFLIHLPAMLSDIPNHDGLSSMYFDQNMITSGRWFLTVACGFSSYFTIPWIIGLIGLAFLGLAAAALVTLLELDDALTICAVSGLLVSFPALASTFAYVFTMDGYMLALFLTVLAVLVTKRFRRGFLGGAVCLAFSMGTYQAYLPFAILLCIYEIWELAIAVQEKTQAKAAIRKGLSYLGMGVLGAALYYVILQILLRIEGKELDTYQGISGLSGGAGLSLSAIRSMYADFITFTFNGNILFQNIFSTIGVGVLAGIVLGILLKMCFARKWWKNPVFFVIIAVSAIVLPPATNIILLISPDVNYHLLMRYQWVLYLILAVAFVSRHAADSGLTFRAAEAGAPHGNALHDLAVRWVSLLAAVVLIFCYAVTDNIGYSNLEKRYEKTYAYCVRLLDRIEQTPGYYQGIPIAMVGVVGYLPYPTTDITESVTGNMIGLSGDFLLYTGENYASFMKNYLGATLNILPADEMNEIYFSEEYTEMESFPAESSVKIVDGVMYVKTENILRD